MAVFAIVVKSRYIQFVIEAAISDRLFWKKQPLFYFGKKLLCVAMTFVIVHDPDLSSLRKPQMLTITVWKRTYY
jgi:hypothetical protein